MSQKTLIDKQTILLQIKDVMFSSALAGAQCWLLMLHVPYWPSNLLLSAVLTFLHWEHLSLLLCLSPAQHAILFSCLLSLSEQPLKE